VIFVLIILKLRVFVLFKTILLISNISSYILLLFSLFVSDHKLLWIFVQRFFLLFIILPFCRSIYVSYIFFKFFFCFFRFILKIFLYYINVLILIRRNSFIDIWELFEGIIVFIIVEIVFLCCHYLEIIFLYIIFSIFLGSLENICHNLRK